VVLSWVSGWHIKHPRSMWRDIWSSIHNGVQFLISLVVLGRAGGTCWNDWATFFTSWSVIVWIGLKTIFSGDHVIGSISYSAMIPDSRFPGYIVVSGFADSNMRPIMKIASYLESKQGAVEVPYGVLSTMVENATFKSSMETWISTSTYISWRKGYCHLFVWNLGISLCTSRQF